MKPPIAWLSKFSFPHCCLYPCCGTQLQGLDRWCPTQWGTISWWLASIFTVIVNVCKELSCFSSSPPMFFRVWTRDIGINVSKAIFSSNMKAISQVPSANVANPPNTLVFWLKIIVTEKINLLGILKQNLSCFEILCFVESVKVQAKSFKLKTIQAGGRTVFAIWSARTVDGILAWAAVTFTRRHILCWLVKFIVFATFFAMCKSSVMSCWAYWNMLALSLTNTIVKININVLVAIFVWVLGCLRWLFVVYF